MAELIMSIMESSFLKIDGDWVFVRHTPISESRRTILCVHGLGDSSLSFLEAFQSPYVRDFNVIAPDLLGHGCTSDASNEDYSFGAQINKLYRVIDELRISTFFLVGHSLGGDIATHLAANDEGRVRGLINVEGNLTPPDVVISKKALRAAERGNFETWFREDFMKMVLNEWGTQWTSCQRYYASLWFCRPQAFLASASEVCQQNSAATPNTVESVTGLMFQQINVPKVYCWGGSMSEETTKLIKDEAIRNWGFKDAFHWPMIDKDQEFYRLLRKFCSGYR